METQPISFRDFPKDLYRQAKIEAAVRGTSVKALVIQALLDLLKKKRSRNGKH